MIPPTKVSDSMTVTATAPTVTPSGVASARAVESALMSTVPDASKIASLA